MPDCEILCVGTELLLGQILNTNAQFFSQELAKLGINCYFQTTVGDNKARIIACIRQALQRSHLLIITGGLGPTADDLTTECVAEALDVPLIFDEQVCARIEEFFKSRGYTMPESNRKQALRPQGAEILPNATGTAPGIIWEVDHNLLSHLGVRDPENRRTILTFPGVPSEVHAMWRDHAATYLQRQYASQTLYSVDLKHYGIGESALAEKYAALLESSNPTVAPYAGTGECKLRVTARGSSYEEAMEMAQPIIKQIEQGSGDLLYGRDDDTLESVLGSMLRAQKMTISFAESCTGGLASKRMTDVAGSSDYVKLNVVTYANEMKQKILAVPRQILDQHGAVSVECANAMANGMRALSESDIAVGITGIAGPGGGTEEKPVGLVYIGLATADGTTARQIRLPAQLGRDQIRYRTASEALNMVRLWLRNRS